MPNWYCADGGRARDRRSIRVWAPACSTGEEAYSVAMLVTELAEAAEKRFELKVFATDAQEGNLRKARDGIYPAAAVAGFPSTRLKRFFEKLDGSFQVSKELREMVVFAPQNLLRDPPFSRLDLVCRNVLIYLEADAQQRIRALSFRAAPWRASLSRQCRDDRTARRPVRDGVEEMADIPKARADPARPRRLSAAARPR
ncbi:CheR family methyltransferase [Mesorhizobium sp. NBSH29]|uniref:CheR family methyltransferase n=1 Tax=Mesorhizobium sp. NBSH29 TaxID=2654249 RepID=UPI001896695A|nr:CheR family methyltransferase [Mesorhizobium sp. NBSH29]